MAAAWQNADGVQVKFGNYWSDPKNFANRPFALNVDGATKEVEIDFDLSLIPTGTVSYHADLNNDGTLDGWSDEDFYLPANSSVVSATLVVTTAAAGGTSFTVGTYRQTGAAVSATGLFTATEGVLANIDTVGKRTNGAGALVATTAGTAGVGANNVCIGIATTGTFTAGKGKIIIRYIEGAAATFANT